MERFKGRKFFAREPSGKPAARALARSRAEKRRLAAGQRRFRFLDLWIRFGKIISKVCEGLNSGAKKLDTNSDFEDERVRSPSPATGGGGPPFGAGSCAPRRPAPERRRAASQKNFLYNF